MSTSLDRIFGAFQRLDPDDARGLSLTAVLDSRSFLTNHSMELRHPHAPITARLHVPSRARRDRVTAERGFQHP